MHTHLDSHQHQYTTRTHVRERSLHWCIILVSLLFIFLLVIESVVSIVLGAWHLTIQHPQTSLSFSADVHRRELAFGILLLIIGSFGVLMSIVGLVAFFTLRLLLLRTFALCLWFVMIVGVVVGIIGIIFALQVDGLMSQSTNSDENDKGVSFEYGEKKLMLGINGGLCLFMSLTMLIGIIIVRCLTGDVNSHTSDHLYHQAK